jgi:prephenate dehydratase
MNIAIQGLRGSFHDEVASTLYPDSASVECTTFEQVFRCVEDGSVDRGIVAIENSLQGSINQTYRLLASTGLKIVKEHYLPVEQYLIGTVKQDVASLNTADTKIYSMFPAFAQVENWLAAHMPHAEKVEYFDTAASVKKIMDDKNHHELAIAGKRAADLYGATIIAGPINDHQHNKTRFFVIENLIEERMSGSKTSVILTTDHTSGALYRALGVFNEHSVNLTKLDSYPIPGDMWHYMFYIDFDGGYQEEETKRLLSELTKMGCAVKVLGSY